MPVHYLTPRGARPATTSTLLRFDSDVGKHGDTGRSEREALAAVLDGRADAAAVGAASWDVFVRAGEVPPGELAPFWTSPPYSHCNFTAMPSLDAEAADAWVAHLRAMDWANPEHRRILELEGLREWVGPNLDGYATCSRPWRSRGSRLDGERTPERERAGGPVRRRSPRPGRRADVRAGRVPVRHRARAGAGADEHERRRSPTSSRPWCRGTGHELVASEPDGDRALYRIRRGAPRGVDVQRSARTGASARRSDRRRGVRHDATGSSGKAALIPDEADPATGFSPRGAVVEAGAPRFPFTENERDRVWAHNVASLYEQATESAVGRLDATSPGTDLPELPDARGAAVCQIMTHLAENEYAALYVPAKFIPRIHPQFTEVVMFLSTQVVDEARHIEAFTKRALANGGGLQYSTAHTQAR